MKPAFADLNGLLASLLLVLQQSMLTKKTFTFTQVLLVQV